MTYKLGWFSTGRDEAACDLLRTVHDNIQNGVINAEISFVFSNRERGEKSESDRFFQLVDEYGIDLVCFSSRDFEPELRRRGRNDENVLNQWRIAYDREIMARIGKYYPDLNVLAGYMLITGPELCTKYTMINLHPAKPGGPTGTWQEVIWKLIEDRADRTGVMMHLVTEILDCGPPITYCTFPIRGGKFDRLWDDLEEKLRKETMEEIIKREGEEEPLFKEIRIEGVRRELPLILQTIKEFSDGNVKVENRQIIAKGEVIPGAYDLTEEIEKQLNLKK